MRNSCWGCLHKPWSLWEKKRWRTDENEKTIDKNIVSGKDTFQNPSQNVTK